MRGRQFNQRLRKPANTGQFRQGRVVVWRPRKRRRGDGFLAVLIAAPLAAFAAVFFWDGSPKSAALTFADLPAEPADFSAYTESASFSRCTGPIRTNCVVDGDTFWLHGEKIRIADINTPETGDPKCAEEAQLGEEATDRLVDLLNEGPFELESVERETDAYDRQLRKVTRDGQSIGGQLVAEGLAERWQGYRSDWCARLAGGASAY